jgi:hypothetical protein
MTSSFHTNRNQNKRQNDLMAKLSRENFYVFRSASFSAKVFCHEKILPWPLPPRTMISLF